MMAAHVMQHPIHLHGQRFVVLTENGVPNTNMVWRDTGLVLPGGFIDILVDMSNTGEWMLHCHIVEHLFAGMMMQYRVEEANGSAAGDAYRARVKPVATNSTGSAVESVGTYTYESVVENYLSVATDKTSYDVGSPEYVGFTFKDPAGNGVALDMNRSVALVATFVSKNGKDHFVTYPGNTDIHNRAPVPPSNTNIPGTPGFDESMPHSHSLYIPIIETAYADSGHAHSGAAPTDFVPTYTVPVYFTEQGEYRAFVEVYVAGDNRPFVSATTFTVGTPSWNVDNYNLTSVYFGKTTKWWLLLAISLLLMAPLSRFVYRYISPKA
jgi:hypothetical protein